MSASPSPELSIAAPPLFAAQAIPPRRIPWAYRLALGLTAFAMVLLPVVYIGLIILAGYGVCYYAQHGLAILEGSHAGVWALIIYVTPLFAGASLIAFMVKPLFASPANAAEPLVLDLEREPELRELIAGICAQVRAPVPHEVRVDCHANASASLRQGWASLGRGDLALTLGLPLVANLKSRQLAGVLAHEFGHFAQGTGMTFAYVIRGVNGWFARVVFERDSWDAQLEEWADGADGRIALVLGGARLAIWTSRKILHGLMLIGHAIACLQLRQMEFDADYYGTHVAGSEAFVETSRELRRLAVVSQTALNELGALWHERRLVDDFPGLMARRRAQLTGEAAAEIDGGTTSAATRWFDTHPSDLAREIRARAMRVPGLIDDNRPAAELFRDFRALCREATEHFYRAELELNFEPGALVPVATAAQKGDEVQAAESARRRLVGDVLHVGRPLVWAAADFMPPAGFAIGTVAGRLAKLRSTMTAEKEGAELKDKAFSLLLEERTNVDLALAFHHVSTELKPEAFKQITLDPEKLQQRRAELTRRLADKAAELRAFEGALDEWVRLVVIAGRMDAMESRIPADLARRIDATAHSLIEFEPWFRALPGWIGEYTVLSAMAANAARFDGNPTFSKALAARRTKAQEMVETAPQLVNGAKWPDSGAAGPATAADALRAKLNGVYGDGRSAAFLQTATALYYRLLGNMMAAGEELERALSATNGGAA